MYSTQVLDMSQTAVTPYNPLTNAIFSPRQISGCALWLDGSDRSSMVFSGNNVTSWRDKSGNTGRDATAVSNPNLSNINGVQAMNMTTASYFTGAVSITTTTLTCFAVANTTRTLPNAAADQRLVSLANTTNADWNGVDRAIGLFNQANSSGIATWRVSGPIALAPITTNSPFMAVSQYTGTNGFIWRNGTAGSITGTASSGSFAITKYGIGNQANPTAEYWVGTIGEVIIYNTALTTAQRQQVEGYLAWKWNLQANLPTTHPYYNNAYLPNSYPISYFPPRMTPTSIVPTVPGFTIPTTIRQYVFNPTSITGAALWLDGADPLNNGIQPISGTVISTWSDKSGNGRNATVASARVAGTFNTALKCVYFQASNVGYVTSYAANPTNETMFIVANIDSPANQNNNTIIGGQRGARSFGFGYAGNGGSGSSSYLNNQVAWQTTSVVGPSAGTTALITGTVSGTTNVTVSLNGGSSTAGTISAWTAGTTTYLGVDTTTTIYYYKGFVMEILFYNSVLSISQRQQIEGYLAWKWGLQSNLPANHPFKLFPP